MRKIKIVCLSILITFIIGTAGCSDKIVSVSDLQPGDPPASNGIRLSKLSELQKQVFTPGCALSGCHGDTGTQAHLNLSEGKAYSSLINMQGLLYPQYKRVVPGNSSASLLIKVLSGNLNLSMPPGGKLNQGVIDSIAVWINKGAPND